MVCHTLKYYPYSEAGFLAILWMIATENSAKLVIVMTIAKILSVTTMIRVAIHPLAAEKTLAMAMMTRANISLTHY
jgi:hypothetical protein